MKTLLASGQNLVNGLCLLLKLGGHRLTSHIIVQDLSTGQSGLFTSIALAYTAPLQRFLLQIRRFAIKDKNGLNFVKEQFGDAMKKTEKMGIGHGIPRFVPVPLDSLIQPNGYI